MDLADLDGGEAEIPDFDGEIVREENVVGLDVPVDDLLAVEVAAKSQRSHY